jgi:hypothetical protein
MIYTKNVHLCSHDFRVVSEGLRQVQEKRFITVIEKAP